ncbi:MAG: hypothetical protein H6669_16180 [Ardenticatenaceae bacterium]|nr:hypothetical protein [Ardenticatenaceae bacterium]
MMIGMLFYHHIVRRPRERKCSTINEKPEQEEEQTPISRSRCFTGVVAILEKGRYNLILMERFA